MEQPGKRAAATPIAGSAERKILVVEDDPDIGQLLEIHLRDLDLGVDVVADGAAGLARACRQAYQLVVLDLMLPGLDGLEVCRRLRNRTERLPILMLSARSSELDRVLGLEIGADDYLTKPFSIMELKARIKALLRRVNRPRSDDLPPADERVSLGPIEIDVAGRRVRIDGDPVDLTAREFDLLLHFTSHPGRVFSRGQLLDDVWGYHHDGYEHTVNSHINRLRKKIEPSPQRPRYIETVRGVGYRMCNG